MLTKNKQTKKPFPVFFQVFVLLISEMFYFYYSSDNQPKNLTFVSHNQAG